MNYEDEMRKLNALALKGLVYVILGVCGALSLHTFAC